MSDVVHRPSRLRALAELDATAESSARALDRIAGTACRVLDVPVALVNLIGGDRQRFVGCGGPDRGRWSSVSEAPLTQGFCPFTLGAEDAFVLPDARADPRHAGNPVVEELGVVAYVGVPLRGADGEPVGTLCAVDERPREWSEQDVALLADLAASAIAELRLLAATRLTAWHRARLSELAQVCSALAVGTTADDGAPTATTDAVVARVHLAVGRPDALGAWLLAGEDGTLRSVAANGAAQHVAAFDARTASAPAEALRTGRPAFLETRAEIRAGCAPLLHALAEAGSIALLPVTAGERALGVLGVAFARERPFTAEERAYLPALAGVGALALARL